MHMYGVVCLLIQSSCQNLLDNVSTSESVRVCREDFFPDPVSGHCKPRCSSWLMFDQPTEIASLAVIGISTVVGILTTVVIITVSCIHFKSM